MPISKERKIEYFTKVENLLDSYSKIIVVGVDNVGSNQLQQIRLAMRGDAVILMGKNTMMRKVLNNYIAKHPGHAVEQLIGRIQGNVGLVFTNGDLSKTREKLEANRVPAPARVGAECPIDVIVPAGPTGCDPGQTAFFQTLQIGTKIVKGQIEITAPVPLLKKGQKVGTSEAALLQKLNIKPFTYGITLLSIYDNGSMYDAAVLDLTPEDLMAKFTKAIRNVAAISLHLGYVNVASVPHSVANSFKNLLLLTNALENYTFPQAEAFKNAKSAFAAAPAAGAAAAAAPVVEAKKEESAADLGGMDMFGGGSSGKGDY